MSATTLKRARIFLVDDHPLVRDGLASLINRQEDMMSCGSAGSIPEAQTGIAEKNPDLAIIDLRLRSGDGLEFIKSLRVQHPSLRILVLSQFDETLYGERVLRAGAHGYVMKEQATEVVLAAIRAIVAGEIYVNRPLFKLMLLRLVEAPAAPQQRSGVGHLTDRELHILQLLGGNLKTPEIAIRLNLSRKTVETYRERLKHKLGVPNAFALTQYACEWLRNQTLPPGTDRASTMQAEPLLSVPA